MVENAKYSRKEDKMHHHHHHHSHSRNPYHRGGTTMSSNGSTKQFIDDHTPRGSPRQTRVVPPEIRVYPSLPHSAEPSRYEPNFMLGYGAPTYPRNPLETTRNHGNDRASRQMKRPKYDSSLLDPRLFLHPPTPELPRTFGYGSVGKGVGADFGGGPKGSYDWHIPRASLWCYHKGYGAEPCKDCQWKHNERGIDVGKDATLSPGGIPADGASICSSINPPPTFTALDNYRPVRPRRPKCRHCSCGIIFAITTVFSLLVLVLIAAFIIYVEMVLKHQTASAMDRM